VNDILKKYYDAAVAKCPELANLEPTRENLLFAIAIAYTIGESDGMKHGAAVIQRVIEVAQ
jgi:hypothetical protein